MKRRFQREGISSRAVAVAVVVAVAALAPVDAAATGIQSAAGDVFIHVPDSFHPDDDKESGAIPLIAGGVDSGKQFMNDAEGVIMTILELPLSSPRETLPELPSTQVPWRLGRSYLGDLLKPGPGKPVRDKVTFALNLDDTVRKMVGIEVSSTMPPIVQTLLDKDDSAPDWREMKEGGVDPKKMRCLMSTIVAAYARGADPVSAGVTTCGASKESAAAAISSLTPAAYKPHRVVERFIQVVTDNGVMIARLQGEESARAAVDSAWREVLQFTTVKSDRRAELADRPWRTDPMARLLWVLGVSLAGVLIYVLVRRARARAAARSEPPSDG